MLSRGEKGIVLGPAQVDEEEIKRVPNRYFPLVVVVVVVAIYYSRNKKNT